MVAVGTPRHGNTEYGIPKDLPLTTGVFCNEYQEYTEWRGNRSLVRGRVGVKGTIRGKLEMTEL